MSEPRSFAGTRVFITGGSSGIGKQLARDFLKLQAHVTIASDRPDKLASATEELAEVSPSVHSFICDIGDLDQVRRTAADYIQKFGAPDILINNAGFAVYRAFKEMDAREIERLVQVNLIGACFVTREFLPAMIQAERGHIVIMTSIAGRLPLTPCGVYSAAKHALVAWAETLRAELYRYGIGVHAICPGRAETDFFSHETFVRRAPRRETRSTVTVEAISRATIQAIRTGRFLTYVPWSYRIFVWLAQSLPLISRPALQRLMRARVASLSPEAAQVGNSERG